MFSNNLVLFARLPYSTWTLYGIVVHGSNDHAMMRRTSLQNHSVNFMNVNAFTSVRMNFVAQMVFRCVTLRHQLSMPQ